jgi:flagellar hook-associated protein 3 FlgL
MKAFIEGPFADLFKGANWSDWSGASDQNIQSRISSTARIETSVGANEDGVRKLAMAYTMAFDLGIERLNDQTRGVLIGKAVEVLAGGMTGVSDMQVKLGTSQAKIEEANERMDLQRSIFDEKIAHLEAVDPAEAKTRIDQLTTQLQTSYSLTAQLKSMSLINFI